MLVHMIKCILLAVFSTLADYSTCAECIDKLYLWFYAALTIYTIVTHCCINLILIYVSLFKSGLKHLDTYPKTRRVLLGKPT